MSSSQIAFPDLQTPMLGLIAYIKFLPDEIIFQNKYERIASLVKPCFRIPQIPPDFTDVQTCFFKNNTIQENWFEIFFKKKKAAFIWLMTAFELKKGKIFEEFVNFF